VANLEEEFTNRMKEEGTDVTSRTIKHVSKTFDEIISQDVHFGTLLHKIKKAYEAYIRKKWGDLQSEEENPSYEELETKIKALEGNIKDKNSIIKKMESDFRTIRNEMENKFFEEKATKDQIIHDLKARIDELWKQVSSIKKENEDLKQRFNSEEEHEKDIEIQNLIHDNTILNEEWIRLKDKWDYLMMKEEKLRYFYETLNSAVLPVQGIYENTVKNIPTERFYEFMGNQKHNKSFPPNKHVDGYYENDSEWMKYYEDSQDHIKKNYNPDYDHTDTKEEFTKSNIPFDPEESFDDLNLPKVEPMSKPPNVPPLNLGDLPEYETSSDEEDGNGQVNYQNGYNYIDKFYKDKFSHQNLKSLKDSPFELSSMGRPEEHNPKKSLALSKSNQPSSSFDFKMSESFEP
jgi:chaperonin cofactor prefoldin